MKTRFIATIAVLTAQGAQTLPQLRINIKNALKVGVTQRETSEVIFQMSLIWWPTFNLRQLRATLSGLGDLVREEALKEWAEFKKNYYYA
ncbi:hypothetical protein H0A36_13930 [Endozoicomonas sp. SM1973]|uniref:Uncharacterized protein n=1 Tax=Spartinivicinus marinus TaxID=2994442 RepID=A0A853ID58_9GAMM|nr:hypothetical protein [Spartinivicinus marinus]